MNVTSRQFTYIACCVFAAALALATATRLHAQSATSAGSDQDAAASGTVVIALKPVVPSDLNGAAVAAPDVLAILAGDLPPGVVAAAEPLFPQLSPVSSTRSPGSIIDLRSIYRIQLRSGESVQETVRRLSADPRIAFAEPDYLAHIVSAPNDPLLPDQWGLAKTRAAEAWDITQGSDEMIIAVIDSGIDGTHPDLQGQLWINPGEIAANAIDDDNNGYIDDVNGWNFAGNDADLSDGSGHGTEVAGIIGAAADNGIGVAGVCWHCRLMTVKVVQSGGTANYSDIARGVVYAVQKGARVINLSLGGDVDSTTLRAAVEYARGTAVVVGGAGNDGAESLFYPAAYTSVVAVGGTDNTDAKVATSNYGAWIDVAAPGEDIRTTTAGGGYGTSSGTSLAAPYVSGLAGLLGSGHPDWPPALIAAQIYQTAAAIDAANPGFQGKLGSGRIDMSEALQIAPSPLLTVTGYAVDGEPRGQPQPGQTFNLDVEVTNLWGPQPNVTANLRTTDANASVIAAEATYENLGTFAPVLGSAPFRVKVADTAPYAYGLSLILDVFEDGRLVSSLPLTVQTAGQTVTVGGRITADTIWTGDRSYLVAGNLIINPGVTLTVEAGTLVKVALDKTIRVEGTLYAEGTLEKQIVFTSSAVSPRPGDWDTIEVRGTLILRHGIVEYAGFGIASLGGNLDIRFSDIRNNGFVKTNYRCGDWGSGICIEQGTAYISGNRICSNDGGNSNSGSGIIVTFGGTGTISDNIICDNNRTVSPDMHDNGGGIKVQSGASFVITNNLLTGNGIGLLARGNTGGVLTAHGNAVYGNILYDAAALFSMQIDAANNYWASTDVQAIAERIHDMWDDITSGEVTYLPLLSTPPSTLPPFLLNLELSPSGVVGIEQAQFTLRFSREMDQATDPLVTFGQTDPFTTHVVLDGAGWTDATTWHGSFDVTSLVPTGVYTIAVTGARSAEGTQIPPDRRFHFTVAYAGQITDQTAPPPPTITASGVTTDISAVKALWSASDVESSIVGYRYAIGTAPRAEDIVAWTTTAAAGLVRSGLMLHDGRTYWISVQARNEGGLWSAAATASFSPGQEDAPDTSVFLHLPLIRR